MSLLSKLLTKIIPAPVLASPVAEIGVSLISPYVDVAKTEGRAAVVRAVTIPQADLVKIAPHVDPAQLQAADAALAQAETNLIMLVAGVPG